MRLKD